MLSDQEEVKAKLALKPVEPVQRIWTYNLIEALNTVGNDRSQQSIWQLMMEVQEHHGTITIGEDQFLPEGVLPGQRIDYQTGEVLDYGPPKQSRPIHPEALAAIQESRLVGFLHRNNMRTAFEEKLRNELLLKSRPSKSGSTASSTDSSTTTSTTAASEKPRKGSATASRPPAIDPSLLDGDDE